MLTGGTDVDFTIAHSVWSLFSVPDGDCDVRQDVDVAEDRAGKLAAEAYRKVEPGHPRMGRSPRVWHRKQGPNTSDVRPSSRDGVRGDTHESIPFVTRPTEAIRGISFEEPTKFLLARAHRPDRHQPGADGDHPLQ